MIKSEQHELLSEKKSRAWIWLIIIAFFLAASLFAFIIYPSMREHSLRAKRSSSWVAANHIVKSANSAVIELRQSNTEVGGTYIISSDKAQNVAVPFDAGKFYEIAEKYYPDIDRYEYFAVIRNEKCEYCAVKKKRGSSGIIGSYPGSGTSLVPRVYSDSGEIIIADEDDTLSDLYRYAYDSIFNE